MIYLLRPVYNILPSSIDFSNYANCIWYMIITMSTLGYGDYYARTVPGRLVSMLAAITGVFLVSIMVVSL